MLDRVNVLLLGTAFAFFLSGCQSPTPRPRATQGNRPQTDQGGKASPSPEPARPTRAGKSGGRAEGKTPLATVSKEVYFAFDGFDLRRTRATLKTNADWLKANPSTRVETRAPGEAHER
jgi:outer membrane protein OmpA-like peptidoglycan-associated protein